MGETTERQRGQTARGPLRVILLVLGCAAIGVLFLAIVVRCADQRTPPHEASSAAAKANTDGVGGESRPASVACDITVMEKHEDGETTTSAIRYWRKGDLVREEEYDEKGELKEIRILRPPDLHRLRPKTRTGTRWDATQGAAHISYWVYRYDPTAPRTERASQRRDGSPSSDALRQERVRGELCDVYATFWGMGEDAVTWLRSGDAVMLRREKIGHSDTVTEDFTNIRLNPRLNASRFRVPRLYLVKTLPSRADANGQP